MDWAQVLVIILAVVLAIFLVLAVVLVSLLIRVTQQIKAVTSSAQRTAEHFEHAVAGAGKAATPLLLFRTIFGRMKKAKKSRR